MAQARAVICSEFVVDWAPPRQVGLSVVQRSENEVRGVFMGIRPRRKVAYYDRICNHLKAKIKLTEGSRLSLLSRCWALLDTARGDGNPAGLGSPKRPAILNRVQTSSLRFFGIASSPEILMI